MWELIIPIIIIYVLFQVFKAITNTQRGAFILVVLPILLCVVNFTIAWEHYWRGVPFPNPVSPGGFLYDIIARIIGGTIDNLLGVDFFTKIFAWILGAFFYVLIFYGLHRSVYYLFICNLGSETRTIVFLGWLAFFTYFYYFRGLDSISVFRWLSMPYMVPKSVLVYYWISIALVLYLYFIEDRL